MLERARLLFRRFASHMPLLCCRYAMIRCLLMPLCRHAAVAERFDADTRHAFRWLMTLAG